MRNMVIESIVNNENGSRRNILVSIICNNVYNNAWKWHNIRKYGKHEM